MHWPRLDREPNEWGSTCACSGGSECVAAGWSRRSRQVSIRRWRRDFQSALPTSLECIRIERMESVGHLPMSRASVRTVGSSAKAVRFRSALHIGQTGRPRSSTDRKSRRCSLGARLLEFGGENGRRYWWRGWYGILAHGRRCDEFRRTGDLRCPVVTPLRWTQSHHA